MTDFPQNMDDFKASITPLIGTGMFSKQEDQLLRDRYINGLTFNECAEARMVTRERIRQIEAKALRKWRQHLRKQQGVMPTLTTMELHRAIPSLIRAGGRVRVVHHGRIVCSAEFTNYVAGVEP
jgi:hypothetical protein